MAVESSSRSIGLIDPKWKKYKSVEEIIAQLKKENPDEMDLIALASVCSALGFHITYKDISIHREFLQGFIKILYKKIKKLREQEKILEQDFTYSSMSAVYVFLSKLPELANDPDTKNLILFLMERSLRLVDNIKFKNIALVLKSLCEFGPLFNEPSLKTLVNALIPKAYFLINLSDEGIDIRSLTQLLRGLSKFPKEIRSHENTWPLIDELIRAGSENIRKFESENIANYLGALCELDLLGKNQAFLEALLERGMNLIDNFNVKGIVLCLTVLCNCNTTGLSRELINSIEKFIKEMAKRAMIQENSFDNFQCTYLLRALLNIVWTELPSTKVYEKCIDIFAKKTSKILQKLNLLTLALLLDAVCNDKVDWLARGHESLESEGNCLYLLFRNLIQEITKRIPGLNSQNALAVVYIFYALSKQASFNQQKYYLDLLHNLVQKIFANADYFKTKQAVMILNAMINIGLHVDSPPYSTFIENLLENIDRTQADFSQDPEILASLLRVLVLLNKGQHALYIKLLQGLSKTDVNRLTVNACSCLHFCQVATGEDFSPEIKQQIAEKQREFAENTKTEASSISSTEALVYNALEIVLEGKGEIRAQQVVGFCLVDFLVVLPDGRLIVVNVDGPYHLAARLLATALRQSNLPTQARDRSLVAAGCVVVNIDNDVCKLLTPLERVGYFHERLRPVLGSVSDPKISRASASSAETVEVAVMTEDGWQTVGSGRRLQSVPLNTGASATRTSSIAFASATNTSSVTSSTSSAAAESTSSASFFSSNTTTTTSLAGAGMYARRSGSPSVVSSSSKEKPEDKKPETNPRQAFKGKFNANKILVKAAGKRQINPYEVAKALALLNRFKLKVVESECFHSETELNKCIRKIIESIHMAIYPKTTLQLLSLSNLFGGCYQYGVRLNPATHPNQAFTWERLLAIRDQCTTQLRSDNLLTGNRPRG